MKIIGPKASFHDDVSRIHGTNSLTHHIIMTGPVLTTQLSAAIENGDVKVVAVQDSPVGCSKGFPHTSHVKFIVLDGSPFPFHALVGFTVTFRDDKAGHHKGRGSIWFVENFKHISGTIVKGIQSILEELKFTKFGATSGFIVFGNELTGVCHVHVNGIRDLSVVLDKLRKCSRHENTSEGRFFLRFHLAEFIQIRHGCKVKLVFLFIDGIFREKVSQTDSSPKVRRFRPSQHPDTFHGRRGRTGCRKQ
mmetsp:Transcript_15351/g.29311  ORF Transcript_15351/g.29311 Transcript_15351/m.29311 type:complete len:249 (+) Transcript_15351:445-1191(+)